MRKPTPDVVMSMSQSCPDPEIVAIAASLRQQRVRQPEPGGYKGRPYGKASRLICTPPAAPDIVVLHMSPLALRVVVAVLVLTRHGAAGV
jgi:hypothetical protein